MLAVTGFRTTLVRELAGMIDEPVVRIRADLSKFDARFDIPEAADRFVLAAGVLHQRRTLEQTPEEIAESLAVNLVNVVRLCETILAGNERARICVIGSVSAEKGSFDQTYAAAKAGVHAYANFRKVLPTQQLIVFASPLISDSGMTRARHDYPQVLEQRPHISAHQVAVRVKRILYGWPPGGNMVDSWC